MNFDVSTLVDREYHKLGAIGIGGGVLDGDVPLVLEELCVESVSELEVGANAESADGIGRVNEMEVQDVIMSFGTAFPVFVTDLIKRGTFAARHTCGGDMGLVA